MRKQLEDSTLKPRCKARHHVGTCVKNAETKPLNDSFISLQGRLRPFVCFWANPVGNHRPAL